MYFLHFGLLCVLKELYKQNAFKFSIENMHDTTWNSHPTSSSHSPYFVWLCKHFFNAFYAILNKKRTFLHIKNHINFVLFNADKMLKYTNKKSRHQTVIYLNLFVFLTDFPKEEVMQLVSLYIYFNVCSPIFFRRMLRF